MDNEYRGKMTSVAVDVLSKEVLVTFAIKADLGYAQEHYPSMIGKELNVGFEEWQEKKSKNANDYFHVLCRKIAQHKDVKQSEAYVKNQMISSYGVPELNENGKQYTIYSNRDFLKMWEQETPHTKLMDVHIKDDEVLYVYGVMKGVRYYNKKEMSRLIEHVVMEAKDLGIETIPPEELERMLNRWQPK